MTAGSGLNARRSASRLTAHFSHEASKLGVFGILDALVGVVRAMIVLEATSAVDVVRTIARHVASLTTHTTDDVGRVALLIRTVVLAVTDLAAVLADLVLVITKGTVQRSEFAKLIALQLVLSFRDRGSLRRVDQ